MVKVHKKTLSHILLLCITACAFVTICSTNTSPLYRGGNIDDAIFETTGKGWANGYPPYQYFFEHKGPFIFFVNALGYLYCLYKWLKQYKQKNITYHNPNYSLFYGMLLSSAMLSNMIHAIGVLGEYLGRIFNESKNRPVYLVREYHEMKEEE